MSSLADNDTIGSPNSPDPQVPPSWWRVVAAPWYGVVHPMGAVRNLTAASRGCFIVTCALALAIAASLMVALALWKATHSYEWIPLPATPGTSGLSPTPASGIGTSASIEQVVYTFSEVWNRWRRAGLFNPAYLIFGLSTMLMSLVITLLAWLYFPFIHCMDRIGRSAARSFRAATAAVGLLVLTSLPIWAFFIALNRGPDPWGPPVGFWRAVPLMVTIAAAALVSPGILEALRGQRRNARLVLYGIWGVVLGAVYLLWPALLVMGNEELYLVSVEALFAMILFLIGRAMRSARPDSHLLLGLPPTCEGCGYDLTLQPADACCPECGRTIGRSLDPYQVRQGAAWENESSRANWGGTFLSAMRTPRSFYSGLRLRTGYREATSFASWNYALLGFGGGAWFFVFSLWEGPLMNIEERALLAVGTGLGTILVCWLGQRLVGAAVATVWTLRRHVPDGRWTAKIIEYESVYLWVFCVYWAMLMIGFMIDDSWIRDIFGSWIRMGPLALPSEAAVVLSGTGLLAIGWLWRYAIALRATRWNNF